MIKEVEVEVEPDPAVAACAGSGCAWWFSSRKSHGCLGESRSRCSKFMLLPMLCCSLVDVRNRVEFRMRRVMGYGR